MTDPGPWGRLETDAPPPPRPRRRVSRLAIWLVLMAVVIGIVVGLVLTYPEALRDGQDWSRLAYGLGLLVLISTGVARLRFDAVGQHLRHIAIWAGVVAVLALAIAYRDELAGVGQHLRVAFSGGEPVPIGEHELVVAQDDGGAFVVVGRVNGERVRFIVDTGATETVLAPADARRLGIDVDGLRYDSLSETANGTGRGAAHTVSRIEVGPIGFDDFPVSVNQAPMSASLLGLTFLRRLDSFEVRGRRLILRWRDGSGAASR